MLFSQFLAAGTFAAFASASPINIPHSVHEKRWETPVGWAKRDALDRRTIMPMRVGLAQSNLDKGFDWLMEVSSPESPRFGKHWSGKQVAEAFAPRSVYLQTRISVIATDRNLPTVTRP